MGPQLQFVNPSFRVVILTEYDCLTSVQSYSHIRFFATPWTAACQASLSVTNSQSLLKLMSIEFVMPSNHLILCHPLLLSPSIFPGNRVFSNELVLRIRWPKYWSFSFIISPSNEYSGLISFRRTGWISLQSKGLSRVFSSTTVQKHQFFGVHTGKTIALTRRTFVGKVMSLLFNTLSRLVIDFLPRCKCLLISWLQSLSEVIQDPKKIKSVTVSTVSPSICHRMMDQMPLFSFLNVEFLSQLFHSSLSLSSRGFL